MSLWIKPILFLGIVWAASTQIPFGKITKEYGIPLTAWPILYTTQIYYTAPVGLGTPAQLSRAAVDLQWAGGYVDSQYCIERRLGSDDPEIYLRYNHSQSFTYHANDTAATTWWTWRPRLSGKVEGFLSYDILSLGKHVQIPGHIFLENLGTCGNSGIGHHDSILGLSPTTRPQYLTGMASSVLTPGPFEEYVRMNKQSGITDKNFFSMLAPYYGKYEGVLSFGSYSEDLFEGDLVKHKLYPEDSKSWTIKAPTIKMRHLNGTIIFEQSIPNRIAYLDSTAPAVILPEKLGIVEKVIESLGVPTERGCNGPAVACDKLSSLPDLILDFDGQEIVLTGEDYFVLTEGLWCYHHQCELQVYPYDEPLVDIDGNDVIVLGTDFLKMVYAVFDWEGRSISFAKPNRSVLSIAKK